MKKISLILLALFLLQGNETCEAGPYEDRIAREAAHKKKEEPKPVPPSEKEEPKPVPPSENEEQKKKEEEEAKLQKKKEEEEAKLQKKKEEEEAKLIEEQKKIEEAKSQNDVTQTKLEEYENGILPEEISTTIASLTMDNFYNKSTINRAIKARLNSETSTAIASNAFQKALNVLGISNNDSGLNTIHEQKVQYEKELAKLSKENSDQEVVVLEAKSLALKNVLNAIENVVGKNFSVDVLKEPISDPSVPKEIKTLFDKILTENNVLINDKDVLKQVLLKKALQPLGLAAQQALEKVTKELDDTNKNIQKEESVKTIIEKLKKLEVYIMQDIAEKNKSSVSKNRKNRYGNSKSSIW